MHRRKVKIIAKYPLLKNYKKVLDQKKLTKFIWLRIITSRWTTVASGTSFISVATQTRTTMSLKIPVFLERLKIHSGPDER